MPTKFNRFVNRIRNTQDVEISCSECLDQVSNYVDLELTGKNAVGQLPQVKQHLDQCSVCSEEYQLLHNLARLEAEDHLPSIESLSKKL